MSKNAESAPGDVTPDEPNFTARPYQDQLLEVCLSRNTIIYLPTGAGKTFIAVMAIKRMSSDLTKPLREGGKRTVFLANTVVLANQQKRCIEETTALKVSVYTGDMNVDCWRRDRWLEEFDESQVLVATCQIVLDVIRHGFISFNHLNLIIFDECHHGCKEHPMHQLMRLYSVHSDVSRPRVIGLTGMLISKSIKAEGVIDSLTALESTFQANIATVKSMQDLRNVMVYSTNPMEHILRFNHGSGDSPDTVDRIEKLVLRMVALLERWPIDESHQKTNLYQMKGKMPAIGSYLRSLLKDFIYQMNDFGLYGASIAILGVIVELEVKKRACATTRSRQLLRVLITGAEQIRHILIQEIYEGEEEDHDATTILSNSSPKIQHLFLYLRKYLKEHNADDLKALIFVQRRHSAKNLYHIIKRYAESEGQRFPIVADFMVGNNSSIPESVEAVLENKWNREVVKRFRRNELNMIVASSVLEEGVDLQMCNLVMCVDSPQSFRSYVQSKGRARMSTSNYVIMTSMGDYNKLIGNLAEYQRIDGVLKEYLIARAIDRSLPLKEDIAMEFADQNSPIFKTPKGAILEETSAVQLLNRYCNTLPNDGFTLATVSWRQVLIPGPKMRPPLIMVIVRLPMQSTVSGEIAGEARVSLQKAKRSAAFQACKRLYEQKELNDNLMPINVKRCMESVQTMYFKHWDRFENENPRTSGTNKQIRVYPIETPEELTGGAAPPLPHSPFFLHSIRVEPRFECSPEYPDTAVLHSLLSSLSTFALLTSKPLPELSSMIFYFNFGSIIVSIQHPAQSVLLNDSSSNSIEQLRSFHTMLFRDLLQTAQPFLVNDHSNQDNSFFIVPINEGRDIDWPTILAFQKLSHCQTQDEANRMAMHFQPNDYLHKVVSPWYRNDKDSRFVVLKVHTDMTPFSPFPTDAYKTFADYMFDRYQLRTMNPNQFLIEVRGITQRLNRLSPGQHLDGSKRRAFRDREFLIPEMCHNYGFPATLWLKATLLPSVLHRTHYMLHAETLRLSINRFMGNTAGLQSKPKPLVEKWWDTKEVETRRSAAVVVSGSESILENPWSGLVVMETTSLVDDPWSDIVDAFEHLDVVDTSVTHHDQALKVDSLSCPWADYEEPRDLNRNLDSVFPLDVQYFNHFLDGYQSEINIEKIMNFNQSIVVPKNPATANLTADDQRIDLLLIKPSTPSEGPQQRDLLAALTCVSSADVFNGERLEVLGDSFLKFSTSVFLVKNHPEWHEGFLTTCKGRMVSNRNLFYLGQHLVGGKLKVLAFDPKSSWMPPLMCVPKELKALLIEQKIPPQCLTKLVASEQEILSGRMTMESIEEFLAPYLGQAASDKPLSDTLKPMYNFLGQQSVADKRIADALEAIMGTCVISFGIERSFNILKYFGIFPAKSDYSRLLHHLFTQPRMRSNIEQRDIDGLLPNYQRLEENLGYTFKDRAFLLQALTHPSFPTNSVTGCYQQLEFLGDAVLDMLVTAYIFERCPQMHQGKLTDLRSALVNNNTLACLCVRNQFHRHILSQNALLAEQIEHFVSFQQSHNHAITEQVLLLISDADSRAMGEHVSVPKALGDVFEALIGAVFLDSGNDLSLTWSVIFRLMHADIAQFMEDTPIQTVRRLYEFVGARPTFDDPFVDDDVVMVTVRFTCKNQLTQAQGFGHNAVDAKFAAAKVALHKLMT